MSNDSVVASYFGVISGCQVFEFLQMDFSLPAPIQIHGVVSTTVFKYEFINSKINAIGIETYS